MDNETNSLFDESDDDTDNTEDIEILSRESNSDTDNKIYLSNDKGLCSPKYYLTKGVSLNVNWL